MAKKKISNGENLEPQKSSAAQFITYIASAGASNEKYELRYEDENIWMSQKMLAAVYGVEIPNIAYHLRKLYEDAELSKETSIKEILIDVGDGRKFAVNHYNLQAIIALGFKIDNIVQDKLFLSDYDRYLLALEEEAKKGKAGQ